MHVPAPLPPAFRLRLPRRCSSPSSASPSGEEPRSLAIPHAGHTGTKSGGVGSSPRGRCASAEGPPVSVFYRMAAAVANCPRRRAATETKPFPLPASADKRLFAPFASVHAGGGARTPPLLIYLADTHNLVDCPACDLQQDGQRAGRWPPEAPQEQKRNPGDQRNSSPMCAQHLRPSLSVCSSDGSSGVALRFRASRSDL